MGRGAVFLGPVGCGPLGPRQEVGVLGTTAATRWRTLHQLGPYLDPSMIK